MLPVVLAAAGLSTYSRAPRATMHRFSALFPSWDRSKQPAAPRAPGALDKVFGWAEKIVVPVGRSGASATSPALARYGRETYWPTTLDKECDKAARILKSFCCMFRTVPLPPSPFLSLAS